MSILWQVFRVYKWRKTALPKPTFIISVNFYFSGLSPLDKN